MLFIAVACLAGFSISLVVTAAFMVHGRSTIPKKSLLKVQANRWALVNGSMHQPVILQQYWKGPFWLTLFLKNPFNSDMSGKLITIWSFGTDTTAWRKLKVLCDASRWKKILEHKVAT